MNALNDLPVASLTFLAGLVCTVIAYISNDISYLEATAAIGFTGVGSYGIGKVRNEAGRGLAR